MTDVDRLVFFLSPHPPVGRVRLARFARVRLLLHALPISLLIFRKKPTVLQYTINLSSFNGVRLDDIALLGSEECRLALASTESQTFY